MALLRQLTKGFEAYLTPNRKAQRPKFGVRVTDISPDGKAMAVSFKFLSGQRYCCAGCQPGLRLQSDFQRLRACFRDEGVEVGRPMKITMRMIQEGGALFAARHGDADTEYFAVERESAVTDVFDEMDADALEADARYFR